MSTNEKINYVEFPARDIDKTKKFFSEVFSWQFEDYGSAYTAFSNAGVDGGFFSSELAASTSEGSALVVLYSDNLETTLSKVVKAGGVIVQNIFSFPGGRRFHFREPSGNEFAVWSDKSEQA